MKWKKRGSGKFGEIGIFSIRQQARVASVLSSAAVPSPHPASAHGATTNLLDVFLSRNTRLRALILLAAFASMVCGVWTWLEIFTFDQDAF
uniref:Uncharacterized protein n=1 Tax=Hyaloperonospora arabidopsidis (strain Emoy2) TaxID=559515 RepID=M4BZ58_HYAAE